MTGYRKFFWKILSVTAALAVLLPRIALGELGVCPPYSKTFGPDDPPEEIVAFIAEIGARPGGGTLRLEAGEYDGLENVPIMGVVCMLGDGDGAKLRDAELTVGFGAILTLRGIRAQSVDVQESAILMAEDAGMFLLLNAGSAFLSNTDCSVIPSNTGVLAMNGGGITLGNLVNAGYALLDGVQLINHQGDTKNPGGIGILNQSSGRLALVRSTVAGNGSCCGYEEACDDYCGEGGIINDGGYVEITQSIVANNTDVDCSGPILDLGYNVFGPGGGCVVTDPTSVEADPGFVGTLGGWINPELGSGSPAIDLIPLELGTPTDGLGRARTDGNGDGVVACDAGALEYGYAGVEAKVRARPYWWKEVGEIDLSASDVITIYVFSTEIFDATQIIFDTVAIEGFGFARDAGGWPYIIDVYRDGLKDYQATWRMSRMPLLSCGYQEHEFLAMTRDGRDVRGLLKFEAVGCAP